MGSQTPISELRTWDAVETASRLKGREVSLEEVIAGAISRAEEAAGLGAVVTPTFDEARKAVAASGPLEGVPTFIKDLAQVKGVRTSWGSRASGHYISRKTDPFVRRFYATGVVSLGKSATPELGLTATTEPLGREPCRNPWDPARSPGGSSGGAAALVAAGVVPIAHASDGGGSIRIPAACCGLVGLKPSRFRIDMEGSNLLPVNVATDGVVTRTVRDTRAFYEALERDQRPKGLPPISHSSWSENRSLKIGMFVESPVGGPVHADTKAAVLATGKLCESLGHRVEPIVCPFDAGVIDDFLSFWGLLAWMQKSSARLMLHWGFDSDNVEPWTAGIARTFTNKPRAAFDATLRLRRFAQAYSRAMGSFDLLLGPTTAQPAPLLGYLATDLPFETVFDRLRTYCPFTPIHNAAGAPAISLPLAKSSEGLPIGVQFSGVPGADRLLIDLAESLEAAAPWERIAPHRDWAAQGRGRAA